MHSLTCCQFIFKASEATLVPCPGPSTLLWLCLLSLAVPFYWCLFKRTFAITLGPLENPGPVLSLGYPFNNFNSIFKVPFVTHCKTLFIGVAAGEKFPASLWWTANPNVVSYFVHSPVKAVSGHRSRLCGLSNLGHCPPHSRHLNIC